MTTVRLMQKDDLDRVREIDAISFGAWWKALRGTDEDIPQRTYTNVLTCWEKGPAGSFVAEEDGNLVGFIFSRTWGSVGWFGTFAVLPEFQGQRIGKTLVEASLDFLQQQPGRTIGLETMPESPNNLGFYPRLGFEFRFPTLLLSRPLETDLPTSHLPRWSVAHRENQERWLEDLRLASDALHPGLDYSKEILVTARYQQGDTLVLTDGGEAIGMSTLRFAPGREGAEPDYGVVTVLFLQSAHRKTELFRTLLEGSEALAAAEGKKELVLSVNALHTWAVDRLLQWGYRVERMRVRMVLAGTDEGPAYDEHVNLASWAG
jgi:ribosomal protein S18 acetylase RimI-like enzyme